jgi:glycosyltransferase involved in cell wall biosynthesis
VSHDAVIETGYVDYENLVRYLAACDILMLPLCNTISNQARWPSRINDYLAVGRPVVTCPVGDVSLLFREHNIGLLADDNPQHFARATLSLLEDQALREEMGSNARRIAEEQLSWENLTGQLETFYHKILNQSDHVGRGGATEKVQEEQHYAT